MFLGLSLTKSKGRLLPKRRPFLGGEERFRPVNPSVRWSSLLAPPPKESFQVPIFICLEIFLRGGTKSIIVYWLALGMEYHVVRSGTQQCDTPQEQASWYVHMGAICALSKAISEAISVCEASAVPHRSLGLQWWAIPPYFCLIR